MPESTQSIVLGGGCFWCLDAAYRLVKGVSDVIAGYAGGNAEDADYYTVATGATGHAEVVRVSFDPGVISLSEILDIFWALHDPTSLNRQGHDEGPEYRSVIFYASDEQKATATASLEKVRPLWDKPIVTALQPLPAFYPAEISQQDYYAHNPSQAYCQVIINPKLQKLRQQFAEHLKT